MKKISLFIYILFITLSMHSQTLPQKVILAENQIAILGVNISPNPTNNDFIVEVNSSDFTTAQISLYNMLGEQLSVRAVELKGGRNNFSYPGINLFPGN